MTKKNYEHIKATLEKEYSKLLHKRDRELFSSAPFKDERIVLIEQEIRVCSDSLKELETLYYSEMEV